MCLMEMRAASRLLDINDLDEALDITAWTNSSLYIEKGHSKWRFKNKLKNRIIFIKNQTQIFSVKHKSFIVFSDDASILLHDST